MTVMIYRSLLSDDHSRVKLQSTENDYINASLVDMEEAQRSYILTQASSAVLGRNLRVELVCWALHKAEHVVTFANDLLFLVF